MAVLKKHEDKEKRAIAKQENIVLKNKTINNGNISPYARAAYIALRYIYSRSSPVQYVTSEGIYRILSNNFKDDVRKPSLQKISEGIEELESLNSISILNKNNMRKQYMIDLGGLFFKTLEVKKDNSKAGFSFTLLKMCDIRKIFNSNFTPTLELKLLAYYANMVSIFRDGGITITKNYLAKMNNIEKATVNKYNDELKRIELIEIIPSTLCYVTNKGVSELPNTYCFFDEYDKVYQNINIYMSDYQKASNYMTEKVKLFNSKQVHSDNSNLKRKYAGVWNAKKGKIRSGEITMDECFSKSYQKELFFFLLERNLNYEESGKSDKIEDLSVFDMYIDYKGIDKDALKDKIKDVKKEMKGGG